MIFDMDGVLIDSENFYFDRRMQFFKEKNILPGSTNKLDFVGLTENGIWEVLVSEKDQRADLRKEYLTYREKHPIDFKIALRKGAEDILDYLKKKSIKIALASSSPQREIDKMLTQNALAPYFDFVISGEKLSKSKPHPEIYQIAVNALDGRHCIAVEDSPVGIASAKAANYIRLH